MIAFSNIFCVVLTYSGKMLWCSILGRVVQRRLHIREEEFGFFEVYRNGSRANANVLSESKGWSLHVEILHHPRSGMQHLLKTHF